MVGVPDKEIQIETLWKEISSDKQNTCVNFEIYLKKDKSALKHHHPKMLQQNLKVSVQHGALSTT